MIDQQWQPIESAPKDGTIILGVRFLSYFIGDDETFTDGATMMWEGGEGRVLEGMWAYTGMMVSPVKDEHLPTHWMPLPSPLSAPTHG